VLFCEFNTIYNNNFIDNPTQAYVYGGEGNLFNLDPPTGGNYWSDYDTSGEGCNDAPPNDDGFCDVPYTKSLGVQDNYPWTVQNGWPEDIIPPTTTVSLSGILGNNGWYISDVTVTLTATDNEGGSGIAQTEYSFDGAYWNLYTAPFAVSTEGTTTVFYRSTDNVGNVEATKEVAIKIDKTAPAIVINVPIDDEAYLLNATVLADWSATDSISGIADETGTVPSGGAIETATVGTKTFSVAATDNAGNTASETVIYQVVYNKTGFLPPIKEAPLQSDFKSGRAVPAKFQLTDANGNCLSTAVAYFMYQLVISGETYGDLEEGVSRSEATEGNLFRYDPEACQYIFNWDIKGFSPGTYNIFADLDDGTSITGQVGVRE